MTTGDRLKQFGKRQGAQLPPAPGPKRSNHVALLVMGTLAVGGTAYALIPAETCPPPSPGMAAPAPGATTCTPRGWSSGRSGYSHYSRWGFFDSGSSSHDSSSRGSSSGTSQESHVSRGGFGSFGRAFASGGE
jgi:hypothetical protein